MNSNRNHTSIQHTTGELKINAFHIPCFISWTNSGPQFLGAEKFPASLIPKGSLIKKILETVSFRSELVSMFKMFRNNFSPAFLSIVYWSKQRFGTMTIIILIASIPGCPLFIYSLTFADNLLALNLCKILFSIKHNKYFHFGLLFTRMQKYPNISN